MKKHSILFVIKGLNLDFTLLNWQTLKIIPSIKSAIIGRWEEYGGIS